MFVVVGFLISATYIKLRYRDLHSGKLGFAKNSQFYCGIMCRVFNVEVRTKGHPTTDTNFLYVGNHMGFVDIFAVSSLIPALFITSQEMRETPVLGTLCEMAGCIFVERRKRSQIMNEVGSLAQALRDGYNIVLYPEATSTNGEQVLPFKKTLMTSAAQANRPIQPGVVNFLEIDGEAYSMNTRDSVCWYGETGFVQAIWQTAKAKNIITEVEFLPIFTATPDMDRAYIAEQVHSAVKAHYRPPAPYAELAPLEIAEES
ncbi:MAG: 1-acyl-sn-glycerol-3-phosphate acyltransferase [Bdellovibrionaceae bacterium]|nr:1-acyl-sn-glycerol-3-phosphate acyltransferase [Pseudobdellovibrionaceae bacterium]